MFLFSSGLETYPQYGALSTEGKSILEIRGQRHTFSGIIPPLPSIIPGVPSLAKLVDLQWGITLSDWYANGVPREHPWAAADADTLDHKSVAQFVNENMVPLTVRFCFRSMTDFHSLLLRQWTEDAKAMIGIFTRMVFAVEPEEVKHLVVAFHERLLF